MIRRMLEAAMRDDVGRLRRGQGAPQRPWLVALVILLIAFMAETASAATISHSITDNLSIATSGTNADKDASYDINMVSDDLNFIRDGLDTTSFEYKLTGQVSADDGNYSTDTARLYGDMAVSFTLPSDPLGVALWDLSLVVSYLGVGGNSGGGTTRSAAPVTLGSSGVASGISSTVNFNNSSEQTLSNIESGSGSLTLDLGGSSEGLYCTSGPSGFLTGGEVIVSIGQKSGLGSFGLNDSLDVSGLGITLDVTLTPHLNFTGQTLNHSLQLVSGETLSGYGTVDGAISGAAGSTITRSGGTLSLGDAGSATGFDFDGTLNVGSGTVELHDSNAAELGSSTTLAGGTINASNGVNLGSGDLLSGYGVVSGDISGATGSTITRSVGYLWLGDAGSATGFDFDGTLNVGGFNVYLYDSNAADLGASTTLGGGFLIASNGVALGSGDMLSGYGGVNNKISGASGSTITASGGTLTLGDVTSPVGFDFAGTLNVGANTVNLWDSNAAELGTSTTLAGGQLNAPSMALGSGETLSGYGTVNGTLDTQGFISGEGPGSEDALNFFGQVTGGGDFGGNIIFSDTYCPGNSTDTVHFENVALASSSTLEIEIGGGQGFFDRLIATGQVDLDGGTLDIRLINSFMPSFGDLFTILVAAGGVNDNYYPTFLGLDLGNGLHFKPVFEDYTLTLVTTPVPKALWLLGSGLLGLVGLRRKFKV